MENQVSKPLNVAVCDDESNALDIIAVSVKKVFASYGVDAKISTYKSSAELLRALRDNRFDLLFLDIKMPNIDGICLATKLNAHGNTADIVFVSSNLDRVYDSFEAHPFGFVRKSEFLTDITSVIGRYVKEKIERNCATTSSLQLKDHGMMISLPAEQIIYVECIRDEQIIHMNGAENISIHSRMNILEEKLSKFDLVRIHKGYFVNCRYIRRFETKCVILTDGTALPVGRSHLDEARGAFMAYIHKNDMTIIG